MAKIVDILRTEKGFTDNRKQYVFYKTAVLHLWTDSFSNIWQGVQFLVKLQNKSQNSFSKKHYLADYLPIAGS